MTENVVTDASNEPVAPHSPTQKTSNKALYIGLGAAAGVLVIGAIVFGAVFAFATAKNLTEAAELAEAAEIYAFRDAATECVPASSYYTIMDGGATITFNRVGLPSAAKVHEVFCVLDALDAPESLGVKMNETRSLDGRREESWGIYTASWTYHPDEGMDLMIEQEITD